ncbi:ion channel [Flammeovirga sp. OC4]|uniref:ion channel n=1 Tax=Flammeovirga sp. OC4 TaxID=1382345 RepID=UPI000694C18F|nr:ion channel [Flammeovirga sp. OC4]
MSDKTSKIQDPGVGVQYEHETKRIINPDGSFNVKRIGTANFVRDAYHWLITINWLPFITVIGSVIVATNVIYAFLYMACGVEHITGVFQTNSIWDEFVQAFFFSVQTFTTVGYGAMSPQSHAISLIASLEAFNGLLLSAFSTGILYGRFSRPISKIVFSKNALLTKFKDTDKDCLQFRVTNSRANTLLNLEASVYVSIQKKQTDTNGNEVFRRQFYDISLERSNIMFMPLSWTIVHMIDEKSPLYNLTLDDLIHQNGEILIVLKGFDETFGQDTYTYHSYFATDFVEGRRFVRNFHVDESGDIILSVKDIHLTDKLPSKEEKK